MESLEIAIVRKAGNITREHSQYQGKIPVPPFAPDPAKSQVTGKTVPIEDVDDEATKEKQILWASGRRVGRIWQKV